jgi:YbbR domain-containing protein
LKQPSNPVNIPIAIASLMISMLLFIIALPGWMNTKPIHSFHVEFSIDKETLPLHFYVKDKPDTIIIHAPADQAEYNNWTQTAKAMANVDSAEPGVKSYPVSLTPLDFRKAVGDTNVFAKIEFEKVTPKHDVPIETVSTGKLANPTLIVDRLVVKTQDATIEGPGKAMSLVDHLRANYRLNTDEGATGQPQSVYLEPVDKNGQVVPDIKVSPDVVLVRAELSLAPETKLAYVQVLFGKSLVPAGYFVKSYSSNPPNVTVSGSSLALSKISKVVADTIDLTGMTETKKLRVKLKPIPLVKISPETVQVTVEVGKFGLNPTSSPSSSTNPQPLSRGQ